MGFNYDALKAFDIGGTTSQSFFSRDIRYTERRHAGDSRIVAMGSWLKPDILSHVLMVNPIADCKFAAEMVRYGLNLDTSIRKAYLEKKGEIIIGFKRFPGLFDDPANITRAQNFLAELKEKGEKYGWEEIGRQMGFKFIHDKDGTLICSTLVEALYKTLFGISFGTEPDPYKVWRDPRLVPVVMA